MSYDTLLLFFEEPVIKVPLWIPFDIPLYGTSYKIKFSLLFTLFLVIPLGLRVIWRPYKWFLIPSIIYVYLDVIRATWDGIIIHHHAINPVDCLLLCYILLILVGFLFVTFLPFWIALCYPIIIYYFILIFKLLRFTNLLESCIIKTPWFFVTETITPSVHNCWLTVARNLVFFSVDSSIWLDMVSKLEHKTYASYPEMLVLLKEYFTELNTPIVIDQGQDPIKVLLICFGIVFGVILVVGLSSKIYCSLLSKKISYPLLSKLDQLDVLISDDRITELSRIYLSKELHYLVDDFLVNSADLLLFLNRYSRDTVAAQEQLNFILIERAIAHLQYLETFFSFV